MIALNDVDACMEALLTKARMGDCLMKSLVLYSFMVGAFPARSDGIGQRYWRLSPLFLPHAIASAIRELW